MATKQGISNVEGQEAVVYVHTFLVDLQTGVVDIGQVCEACLFSSSLVDYLVMPLNAAAMLSTVQSGYSVWPVDDLIGDHQSLPAPFLELVTSFHRQKPDSRR